MRAVRDSLVDLLHLEGDRLRRAEPDLRLYAGSRHLPTGVLSCWLTVTPPDAARPSMEISIDLLGETGRYRLRSDIATFGGRIDAEWDSGPELRPLDELVPSLRRFYTLHADLSLRLAREE
ncbi:hypothetical protein ADL15_41290 [Actinoplanes awajinensis subsp. mycoplanecinus]|uniref:Uncharacterized protein n=2 Tax=Actinoplanes TaxID=1865 RepID=A0A101JE45_9ACTN|nr:hypothetical protein ADL15_41290 [Actinoplanes awajinensis subsp. mycoplanecinus]